MLVIPEAGKLNFHCGLPTERPTAQTIEADITASNHAQHILEKGVTVLPETGVTTSYSLMPFRVAY